MSCVSVHSTVAFVLLVIIRSSQGTSTMYVMSYYVRSLYYVSRLYYVCMVAGRRLWYYVFTVQLMSQVVMLAYASDGPLPQVDFLNNMIYMSFVGPRLCGCSQSR